jgi:hypothetical protein
VTEVLPEWERVLSAERHLQALLPGAVLVGGTAASLHAGHRRSLDGDHVLVDLREHFDEVLASLEQAAGWTSSRVQRPVLILGSLDGVQTGVRQLRRVRPLETEVLQGLRVPTLPEMARIKAWLLVTRNTVRDYLDTVVLLSRLGPDREVEALRPLDELYPQASGASVRAELVERLAAGTPRDLAEVDLRSYKGLVAPWNDWTHLVSQGRRLARDLAGSVLQGSDQ